MITFECPGCTKPFEANRAFAGFETRCLRCGSVIRIPERSGEVPDTLSKAGLPTPKPKLAPPPARRPAPPPPLPKPAAPAPDLDFDPSYDSPSVGTAVLPEPPSAAPRRRTLKAESVPAEPEASPEPPTVNAAQIRRRKVKKQRTWGGLIGVIVAIALVAIFGSGEKKKPTTPAKQSPPPEVAKKSPEPSPPPPEAPRKVEPPPVVVLSQAPMPRSVRPAVEFERTAASLLIEYGEAPVATDARLDGKDILVRGVFHQYALGKVTLVANDERSTPLSFALMPPAELSPGELLPNPGLTPGQSVVMRGTYNAGCRFTEATVELRDSAADREFHGKPLCLDGATIRAIATPTGSQPLPAIQLEPIATDSKLLVTCYFKVSDLDEVTRLKPGRIINVRGLCSGRTYANVRIDNCSIVAPEEKTGNEVARVPFHAFCAAYESDLLSFPRVSLRDPTAEVLPVTAEGLGHAFQIDPRSASLVYRNKPVQISGYVKERHANTRMLVLQCGTDTAYSVAVMFSAREFENLPEEKTIVLRGVCSGLFGGYIRIESAEYAETGSPGKSLRTEIDFLPYRTGKEYIVDQLALGRAKDSPITRMAVRFGGDDQIQVVVLKNGLFPGTTLFRDPQPAIKWSAIPAKAAPLSRRHRVQEGVVEIGLPYNAGDKDKREVREFWEPVLKSGLKPGQSWPARFPDGKLATYTVMGFRQTEGQPDQLDIKRTLRDPQDPTKWEETGCTYARGIGEIRRIVTSRNNLGEAVVKSEMRLVSDGTQPELKSELNRDAKP